MRLYEFEAKRLLEKSGIPVPAGSVAETPADAERVATELGGPVVVKSQVLHRRRGAAGGVKLAATPAEARAAAEEILAIEISGETPTRVLVERKIEAAKEFCLHCTYDAVAKLPVMVASDMGGNDIDDLSDDHPDHVFRRHFSSLAPLSGYREKELAKMLGFTGSELNRLTGIISRLARLFFASDFTFSEINALAQTADGKFVALDAHLDMEEEGRPRQKAIHEMFGISLDDPRGARAQTAFEIEAAKIDEDDPRGLISPVAEFDGNIGLVIGAGGGSLTTFDAVTRHGGKPANYAALGGNPSVDKARKLTKLVLTKPGVDKVAVISNVVSNTRADLVARGVIKGVLELGFEPADKITIFRVPGAWEADAFKILEKYGVEYCDRTVSLSEAASRAVAKANASAS